MRIAIILGTRPEIIKFTPIIRECERLKLDYFILHTGQHYSPNMDKVFFEQLRLPEPQYNLHVGSGSYAHEVSKMLSGMEKVLVNEKPCVAFVLGDTNTALAGALAASRCDILVSHVEAGLRSYFDGMPEEINRVIADHHSDFLFAPTERAKSILLSEGIPETRVFVTGNTVVDTIYQSLPQSRKSLDAIGYSTYMLATIHRHENVRNRDRFVSILRGLEMVSSKFNTPILYPIHPGAKKMMAEFGLQTTVQVMEPVDYIRFLSLEEHASLVLTDSGSVQEEACILHTPCVTLRDNTERPETIDVGANILSGISPESILECARTMLAKGNVWENPFGDGRAAQRIIETIRRFCE